MENKQFYQKTNIFVKYITGTITGTPTNSYQQRILKYIPDNIFL